MPFLLGIALTICAAILGLQAVRIDAPGGWRHLAARLTGPEAGRVVVALALVLTYSLVLLGRMPFWLASGLFIFAFIIVFGGAAVGLAGLHSQEGTCGGSPSPSSLEPVSPTSSR